MFFAIPTVVGFCLTFLLSPSSGLDFYKNVSDESGIASVQGRIKAMLSAMSKSQLPAVGGQPLAADQCSSLHSCSTCAANSACHWCGAQTDVQLVEYNTTFVPFGVCQPTSTNCANVKFGTLNDQLNFDFQEMKLTLKSVDIASSDEWCTSAVSPPEVATEDCKQCLDLGKDYGWCTADVSAFDTQLMSPAVCLRKDLHFLCNGEMLPAKLPTIFSLFRLKTILGTEGACDKDTPLPPPSDVCSENLSCDTCHRSGAKGGCTYCGGMFKSETRFGEMNANVFGVCIDGADASCDKVTFGTLANYLNDVPFTSYHTKKLEKEDDYCTTVMWPSEGALDCKDCIPHDHRGWCQMTATIPKPDNSTEHVKGGYCSDEGLSFLCTLSYKEYDAKSQWYSNGCPAA